MASPSASSINAIGVPRDQNLRTFLLNANPFQILR